MENYHHCDQQTIGIKVVDVEEANREKQHQQELYKKNHEEEEVIQIKVQGSSRQVWEFKQFDIISLTGHQDKNRVTSNNAHDRIMQEWKTLEKGLPDSVYVRVLEHNVARAVVVGAPGTPNCHGLFFFDITLPPNYPIVPPEIHPCYPETAYSLKKIQTYHTTRNEFDSRLVSKNPLVKTWDANVSTLADLLISIQLPFQTQNPYFGSPYLSMNDPRLAEAIKLGCKVKVDESFDCNERVFKKNCQLMLATLRDPPKHFQGFVAQHFRDCAESILTAFKPYRIKCGDNPRYETKLCKEYQESMLSMYTKLLKAFIKNGSSSLDDFIGDIDLDDDDSGYVETVKCTLSHYVAACSVFTVIFIVLIWGIYEVIRTKNRSF